MVGKIQYKVGAHDLELTRKDGRWTAAVDGIAVDRWFTSSADAWTAGVEEADRIDRFAASSLAPGAGPGKA